MQNFAASIPVDPKDLHWYPNLSKYIIQNELFKPPRKYKLFQNIFYMQSFVEQNSTSSYTIIHLHICVLITPSLMFSNIFFPLFISYRIYGFSSTVKSNKIWQHLTWQSGHFRLIIRHTSHLQMTITFENIYWYQCIFILRYLHLSTKKNGPLHSTKCIRGGSDHAPPHSIYSLYS